MSVDPSSYDEVTGVDAEALAHVAGGGRRQWVPCQVLERRVRGGYRVRLNSFSIIGPRIQIVTAREVRPRKDHDG